MARKPNHRLSDAERYKGQIASRASANQNAAIRRTGWLIDAADYILSWRRAGNLGDPPKSKLRRFLAGRDWTSERGDEISRTEVDRLLESVDPATSGIPRTIAEWKSFKKGTLTIPNGEILTVAIKAKDWREFQQAQKDGWQPTWNTRSLSADEEEAQAARLRELIAQSSVQRQRRE